MSASVGRNDPCPCGSGLKYKQCCAGKMRLNMSGRRGWILGAIGLGIVAIVAWGLMRSQSRPAAPTGMGTRAPNTSAGTGTATGTNPATSTSTVNPAPAGTGAPMTMTAPAGVAPAAWTYDAQKNQHWDRKNPVARVSSLSPRSTSGLAGSMPRSSSSSSTGSVRCTRSWTLVARP